MAGLLVLVLAAFGGAGGPSPGKVARPTGTPLPRCAKAVPRRRPAGRACRFGVWWPGRKPATAARPVAPPVASTSEPSTEPAPAAPEPATEPAPPPAQPTEPAPQPAPPPPPPATPLPRRLQIDEGEWYVRPSRRRVAAGRVEMSISNFGEDAHDLAIEAGGVTYGKVDLAPGQTKRIFVEVPAGAYKLYCTLKAGEHEAAGMRATLAAE